MRARRGVTISPSTKRYIYLVNTKNHRFAFKTEVKTKSGERCSNLLLCDNKNDRRKAKFFIVFMNTYCISSLIYACKRRVQDIFSLYASLRRSYDIGRVIAARSRVHRAQQKAPVDTNDRWRPGRLSPNEKLSLTVPGGDRRFRCRSWNWRWYPRPGSPRTPCRAARCTGLQQTNAASSRLASFEFICASCRSTSIGVHHGRIING